MVFKILVINPGSTSTKVAIYENTKCLFVENIEHRQQELAVYDEIINQFDFRKNSIQESITKRGYDLSNLSAVIGRGGMIPGLSTGGYVVNDQMIKILKSDSIPAHASNLGALIAYSIAKPLGIPAYIYDSITSSELSDVAKITGFPKVIRQSFCHALNSRAMSIKYAKEQGKSYKDMNLIVAHLGGGISVSVHKDGRIIDSLSDDDGQFSPERSGSVPLLNVIDLCYSGEYTKDVMKKMVRGKGGLYAHLGTSDCREIEKRIENGDLYAKLVFEAQAYQIAKGIGLLAPALKGKIDAIILTGGVANSNKLTGLVIEHVEFLAPVVIMPGENEMGALAQGAFRILSNQEECKELR